MRIAKPVKGRADRALELLEQGLSSAQIKERLGFKDVNAVGAAIVRARARREKAREAAE
jgi:hypothetical protein